MNAQLPMSHQTLIDRLPMAAYAVSAPDGVIAWFNTMATKLWGRQPEIGSLDERFCGAYRLYRSDGTYMAHTDTPIVDALKNGTSLHDQDVIIERPDGSRVTVCVHIDAVRDENQKIIGVTNFFYDVTDRKAREEYIKSQAELLATAVQRGAEVEAALRKSEQQLLEGDRRKDEFLAMLAHELRNPLAPLASASEMLTRISNEDDRAQACAGMIKRQVTQLTRLVDDLLDVSRLTQGRIQLQRQTIDLSTVIAQVVENADPVLRKKGQRLSTVWSSHGLHVDGDPVRLVQCVGNVLNNAIKYTEPGGEIVIRVRGDAENVFIEISDTGSGISPELLPHIFDLFVQSERTLARSGGGLGIGLAVVKRLVEMHGGGIEARSDGADRGSVFEIRLPRVLRAAQQSEEKARQVTEPRRVLIVDDNPDAADSLAELLKFDNHETQVAYNGEDALECAGGFRPDVALIDIGLPAMDGYELARRLRSMKLNGIRLVALTGYGQPGDVARTRKEGFDDHLVKPVDHALLEQVIAASHSSTRA